MIQFKNTFLLFLLTFVCFACKDNREKRREFVSEKIESFSEKQAEWDNLTKRILKNEFVNSNLGKYINSIDLDKSLASELTEKGIKRISVRNSSECKEVEYTTEWTNYQITYLYLTWTTCDSKQTEKGFYQSDSSFIEIYGIGNNWLVWTDGDPI